MLTGGVPSRGCRSGHVPKGETCSAELPPNFDDDIRHEREVNLGVENTWNLFSAHQGSVICVPHARCFFNPLICMRTGDSESGQESVRSRCLSSRGPQPCFRYLHAWLSVPGRCQPWASCRVSWDVKLRTHPEPAQDTRLSPGRSLESRHNLVQEEYGTEGTLTLSHQKPLHIPAGRSSLHLWLISPSAALREIVRVTLLVRRINRPIPFGTTASVACHTCL